jgi:hypothetical protein
MRFGPRLNDSVLPGQHHPISPKHIHNPLETLNFVDLQQQHNAKTGFARREFFVSSQQNSWICS